MRSGTKHLRIASAIQIILGLGGILLTYFLIGQGDISNSGISAEHALLTLILAFQILAGLFGLLLSKKKSLFTVILGVLLFIPQLITFIHVKNDIALIIINAILLAIPYYYLHNAYKNLKA